MALYTTPDNAEDIAYLIERFDGRIWTPFPHRIPSQLLSAYVRHRYSSVPFSSPNPFLTPENPRPNSFDSSPGSRPHLRPLSNLNFMARMDSDSDLSPSSMSPMRQWSSQPLGQLSAPNPGSRPLPRTVQLNFSDSDSDLSPSSMSPDTLRQGRTNPLPRLYSDSYPTDQWPSSSSSPFSDSSWTSANSPVSFFRARDAELDQNYPRPHQELPGWNRTPSPRSGIIRRPDSPRPPLPPSSPSYLRRRNRNFSRYDDMDPLSANRPGYYITSPSSPRLFSHYDDLGQISASSPSSSYATTPMSPVRSRYADFDSPGSSLV